MNGTQYVLSIDCGLSTGIALLSYDDEAPASLVQAWQFSGGVAGLVRWLKSSPLPLSMCTSGIYTMSGGIKWTSPRLTVITEKFTARSTKGFAYTTASLEPLRCEGALIALGVMPDYEGKSTPQWRDPGQQYIFGGTEKASKKKAQAKWLKENGFYVTGKTVDAPDADDARSAIAHGICYIVKELKHKPTWDLVRGDSDA